MATIKKAYIGKGVLPKKGKMVKKAQLGSLVKGVLKNVEKSIPKRITKFSSEAEKIAAGYEPKMIGGGKGNTSGKVVTLKQQEAKTALKKAIEKRTNPKKPSYDQSVWDSYQRNGGKTKKSMKKGGKISKSSKK